MATIVLRIVIWTLVLIFLISLLVIGLTGNLFNRFVDLSGLSSIYGGGDKYTVGGGNVGGESINIIKINWVSGRVDVVTHDGEDIIFSESGDDYLDSNEKMRYLAEDGVLDIRFSGNSIFTPSCGLNMLEKKNLKVMIPENLKFDAVEISAVSASVTLQPVKVSSLSVRTTSGSIETGGADGDKFVFSSVSGKAELQNLTGNSIDVSTTSGSISLTGCEFDSAKLSSVSGRITAEGKYADIDGSNVSGKIDITPGAGAGNIKTSTVS